MFDKLALSVEIPKIKKAMVISMQRKRAGLYAPLSTMASKDPHHGEELDPMGRPVWSQLGPMLSHL